MAVKLDISVLLEVVGAEHYTERLANNGVVTIEQCTALTEERLEECGIPTWEHFLIHHHHYHHHHYHHHHSKIADYYGTCMLELGCLHNSFHAKINDISHVLASYLQ